MTFFHKSALVVFAIAATALAHADDYVIPHEGLFEGLTFGSAWKMTFAVDAATNSSGVGRSQEPYQAAVTTGTASSAGSGNELVTWGPGGGSSYPTGGSDGTYVFGALLGNYCWVAPETLSTTQDLQHSSYDIPAAPGGGPGDFLQTYLIDPPTSTGSGQFITFKDLQTNGVSTNYIRAYAWAIPSGNTKAFTVSLPKFSGEKTFCAYFITEIRMDYSGQNAGSHPASYNYFSSVMRKFKVISGGVKIRSIDTRVTYGQPDHAGKLDPDPNASIGYVNFNNWSFGGGLFMGNGEAQGAQFGDENPPPPARKDKSGIARILARPIIQGPITDYSLSSCSLGLYDLGRPNRPGYKKGPISFQCEVGGSPGTIDESLWNYSNKFDVDHPGASFALGSTMTITDTTANENEPGPTKDTVGSTEKYYFCGSSVFDPNTQFMQLRVAGDWDVTPTPGGWRYFVSTPFLNSFPEGAGAGRTKFSVRLPLAGWVFKSNSNFTGQ